MVEMTESAQPFLSRRERREAEQALAGNSSPVSDLAPFPTRRELRRLAHETGVIPVLTPDMVDAGVETPPTTLSPTLEGDWRDQLQADYDHGMVANHDSGVGVVQSPALHTLVVDSYHTGDITGPLNSTGEIIITGQILLDSLSDVDPIAAPFDAGIEVNQPGIPRRAAEALSIIGKPSRDVGSKRGLSVGSAVAAGLAAFLGLTVVGLGLLAYFTDII